MTRTMRRILSALMIVVTLCSFSAYGDEAISREGYHELYSAIRDGEATDSQLMQVEALLETVPEQQVELIQCLGQYGERATNCLPGIIQILDDEYVYTRGRAARALGRFGILAKAATPRIIELMNANDQGSHTAIEVLGEIGDEVAIPHLLKWLKSGKDHAWYAAQPLSTFPIGQLNQYCDFRYYVEVVLSRVSNPEVSSREEAFEQSASCSYNGMIEVDGQAFKINRTSYRLRQQDLTYVVVDPLGDAFTLNVVHPKDIYWGDITLSSTGQVSFTTAGTRPGFLWVQQKTPKFNLSGIYQFHVEGTFTSSDPELPPLPFVSNALSFEVNEAFQTKAEIQEAEADIKKAAEEAFERENPLGAIHVLGNVNAPGKYGFTPGIHLSDAIKKAGGMTRLANSKGVSIKRDTEPPTKIQVNYSAVYLGNTEDVPLECGDVIWVPERCGL